MSYKGIFRPQNPAKYDGNVARIIYRSRWELMLMQRLDVDKNVIAWASEPFGIPYMDPVTGNMKRYYPDFLVKKRAPAGEINTVLIEIKPAKETVLPTRGRKTVRRFTTEMMIYARNTAKWAAAERLCEVKEWAFLKLTERDLGLSF